MQVIGDSGPSLRRRDRQQRPGPGRQLRRHPERRQRRADPCTTPSSASTANGNAARRRAAALWAAQHRRAGQLLPQRRQRDHVPRRGLLTSSIEHNVFDTGAYPYAIMLGGDDGSVIRHNTLPAIGRCAYGMPLRHPCSSPDGPEHRAGPRHGRRGQHPGRALGRRREQAARRPPQPPGDERRRRGRPRGPPCVHRRRASEVARGFRLAHGSPGRKAASDGADVGIAGGVAG